MTFMMRDFVLMWLAGDQLAALQISDDASEMRFEGCGDACAQATVHLRMWTCSMRRTAAGLGTRKASGKLVVIWLLLRCHPAWCFSQVALQVRQLVCALGRYGWCAFILPGLAVVQQLAWPHCEYTAYFKIDLF
jgi:hypothetical protein